MYTCNMDNCPFSCDKAPAMSHHKRTKHAELMVECRHDFCTLRFISSDRERSHFFREHMKLKCGFPNCSKHDRAYSEWKKLKLHLDKEHAEDSYKTERADGNKKQRVSSAAEQPERLSEQVQPINESTEARNLDEADASGQEKRLLANQLLSQAKMVQGKLKLQLLENASALLAEALASESTADDLDESPLSSNLQKRKRDSSLESITIDLSGSTCPNCFAKFSSTKGLRRHYADMHSQKTFDCHICDLQFDTSAKLYHHKQTDHYKKKRLAPYGCNDCERAFYVKDDLINHQARVHGIGEVMQYRCRHCIANDQTYSSVSNLNKHIRKDHPGEATFTKATINQ